MKLLERKAAPAGEVELAAALEQARTNLVATEQEASAAIANARSSVSLAQSRLDDHRLDVIGRAAQTWRTHAEALRKRAAETDGLETTVIAVTTFGGADGVTTRPELIFVRTQLLEQADGADVKAQLYENYVSRGRDSAMLTTVVAELELPAEAVEPVAVPA
jgi:hypothetical protein